jgi:hypothetical protein
MKLDRSEWVRMLRSSWGILIRSVTEIKRVDEVLAVARQDRQDRQDRLDRLDRLDRAMTEEEGERSRAETRLALPGRESSIENRGGETLPGGEYIV